MAKSPAQLQSLARSHCPAAIRVCHGILHNKETPPQVKLQAAVILMDRGLGKPQQAVTLDVAVAITAIERTIVKPGAILEASPPAIIDITPEPDNPTESGD